MLFTFQSTYFKISTLIYTNYLVIVESNFTADSRLGVDFNCRWGKVLAHKPLELNTNVEERCMCI